MDIKYSSVIIICISVKHLEILEQFSHEENPPAPKEQHLHSQSPYSSLIYGSSSYYRALLLIHTHLCAEHYSRVCNKPNTHPLSLSFLDGEHVV